MAALWFQLLEGAVRSLFHDNPGISLHNFFIIILKLFILRIKNNNLITLSRFLDSYFVTIETKMHPYKWHAA